MDSFEGLKFNVLKSHYPQLKSKREFLTSSSYVGNVTLVIESDSERLTANNLFQAAKKALGEVAKHVRGIVQEYEGIIMMGTNKNRFSLSRKVTI